MGGNPNKKILSVGIQLDHSSGHNKVPATKHFDISVFILTADDGE